MQDKTRLQEGEKTKDEHFIKRYHWTLILVTISLLSVVFFSYYVLSRPIFTEGGQFVEKEALKNDLASVIRNGATLDLIKHVYNNRVRQPMPLLGFKKEDFLLFYSENTPLSSVLNDLCVDYLKGIPSKADSLYYSRLQTIIQENQYRNPFDNLEDIQIRYFENIKYKVGDKYDVVADDMNQIVKELSNKNQLVSKYLNKSTSSFIISIIALFFSIVLSIVQLVQSNKNTTNLLKRLPEEKNSESDS